jgi:hypothetical protein
MMIRGAELEYFTYHHGHVCRKTGQSVDVNLKHVTIRHGFVRIESTNLRVPRFHVLVIASFQSNDESAWEPAAPTLYYTTIAARVHMVHISDR